MAPLWMMWMRFFWRVICGVFRALFSCGRRRLKTPDLSADVCLVTGAGQGLGRQFALTLAECGATLVLWDINEEKVRAVAGEIREGGRDAYSYVVDISKKEDVYRVAAQVRDEVGDVAVLINNAAFSPTKNYVSGELTDEEISRCFSVNALAPFWMVRAFLPWMMENNYGYIVNVASAAAFVGFPFLTPYSATKAALRSFSESLRFELLRKGKGGISVTCVFPGLISTESVVDHFTLDDGKKGSCVTPEEVTRAVLNAMVEKKSFLVVPKGTTFMPIVKSIVPQEAFDLIIEEFGDMYEKQVKKKD